MNQLTMTEEFIVKYKKKVSKFLEAGQFAEYHSDWNLICLTIDKIESIYDEFHGRFQVFIVGNSCCIRVTNLNTSNELDYAYFSETYGKDKKEAVILAVNKFIDFYNKSLK